MLCKKAQCPAAKAAWDAALTSRTAGMQSPHCTVLGAGCAMQLSRRQESSGCAAGTSTVAGMQGMKSDLAELDVTLLVVDMLELLLQGCQLCLQLLHQ